MNDHVNPIIAQALETVVPPDNRTIADRIASLRETARREWAASLEATARSYDAESEAYRLEGDAIRCEFYASIAATCRNEPGATDRKERAYAALVAARKNGISRAG